MKVSLIVMVVMTSLLPSTLGDEGCKENSEDCNSTNYDVYVRCVRERRMKRSVNCQQRSNNCDGDGTNSCTSSSSCDNCECGECEEGCQYAGSCNSCCTSCCPSINTSCTTHHCCHKVCHSACRNTECRTSCRKRCFEHANSDKRHTGTVTRYDGNTSIHAESKTGYNVSTIIHLNNIINNTNVIDTPIRVNTTNVNNITIPSYWDSQAGHNDSHSHEHYHRKDCCSVYSPRICQPQDKFPFVKCFHYRYRMCGEMCYSRIMHMYKQNVCTGQQQTSCRQSQTLVPQPNPSCAYSPQWPYVSCAPLQRPANCQGCYQHHFGQERLSSCNSFCYDDGFSAGSYYRQGPFYQPSYSPMPPCYLGGGCSSPYGYPYAGLTPQYGPGYLPPMPQPYPALGFNPFAYNPMGYPGMNGGLSQQLPPPLIYDQGTIKTNTNTDGGGIENGSVSAPVLINEPFLYNQMAFPYNYNMYPQVVNVENITHDPIIHAEVDSKQDDSYAQIKIIPERKTDKNAI